MTIRPAQSTAGRALQLLDSFALSVDGSEVELPGGARRVLAFLAVSDGPVRRDHVAFSLWPDSPEERSRGNLRAALWRLRKTGVDVVVQTAGRLRLGDGTRVDVRDVVEEARAVLRGDGSGDAGEVCRRLTSGDLLADWYDPWLSEPREQVRQLRLHALEVLSARELTEGRIAQAIESGLAAVAVEPLRESAHRLLIQAHLAEANSAEALRQYEHFRVLLFGELGILPSPNIEDLVSPIRAPNRRRAG